MSNSKEIKIKGKAHLIEIIAALSSATSIAALIFFLILSGHGLDLTDEGFYLNWIHNPSYFAGGVSFFGHAYHPIYRLLGENIRWLRIFNILSLYVTSYWLSVEAQEYKQNKREGSFFNMGSSLNAIAISALSLASLNILTPNYNSLALMGCLVTSIFFLRITSKRKNSKLEEAFNITGLSLALAITGLAKATTLASIIACLLIWIGLNRSRKGIFIGIAIGISMASLSPFYLELNLRDLTIFTEYIDQGLTTLSMLGSAHGGNSIIDSLISLISKEPPSKKLLLAAFVATLSIYQSLTANNRYIKIAAICLASVLSFLLFEMQFEYVNRRLIYPATILAAISFGILTIDAVNNTRWSQHQPDENAKYKIRRLTYTYSTFMLLISMPINYSIGTGVNLWRHSSSALIFYAVASLMIFSQKQYKKNAKTLITIVSAVFLLISLPSIHGLLIEKPYRQNIPLSKQLYATQIHSNSSLLLGKEISHAIHEFQDIIKRESVEEIPIIDLTGHYPGLIYAIGAKPVGSAWLIGGYPGSNETANYALMTEKQHVINSSWVLIEKDGERSLDHEILEEISHGKKALKRMQKIAEIQIPVYTKKYKKTILQLYKPFENSPLKSKTSPSMMQ